MKLQALAKHLACVAVITCFLSSTLGAWVHQTSAGVAVAGAGSAGYYANEWRQAKKELKALEAAEKLQGQKSPNGIVLRKLIAARKKCAISSLVALLAALAAWRSRGEKESPSVDRSGAVEQPKKEDGSAALPLLASDGIVKPLKATPKKKSKAIDIPVPPATKLASATALVETPPEETPPVRRDSANLEEQDKDGHTPLMRAARVGDIGEMQTLVKAGAVIEARSNIYSTALMFAAECGHAEAAEALITAGAEVDARNNDGFTALMYAAECGHTEVIETLIKAGADVDATSNNGWTALTWAARDGHVEALRVLLENGADVDARGNFWLTALMLAAENGHVDALRVLLENGAAINAKNSIGLTALMKAAQNGHVEVLRVLLENGATVNAGGSGLTALMIAAGNGHVDALRVLLENGADVDAKASTGWTALMYAYRNAEGITVLIEAGADVDARNEIGDTALTIASDNGYSDIVALLEAAQKAKE